MDKVEKDVNENKNENVVGENKKGQYRKENVISDNKLNNEKKEMNKYDENEKHKKSIQTENIDLTQETKIFKIIKDSDVVKEETRVLNINKKIPSENKNKENNINRKNSNFQNYNQNHQDNIIEKEMSDNELENKNSIIKHDFKIEEKTKNENSLEKIKDENSLGKIENGNSLKKIKNENSLEKIKNENCLNKKYDQENKKENKKIGLVTCLIILIIFFILVIFSTLFALINQNSNKIAKGIFVNGIEISDLTKDEAIELLEYNLNNNEKNIITVKRNDYSKQIALSDVDGKFDVNKIVEEAYNYSRNDNLIKNNYKIIYTLLFKNNYNLDFIYNEEKLEKIIDEVSLDFPDIANDSSYIIKDNKLIIKNSTAGVKIKKDAFSEQLINAFSSNSKSFNIIVEKCNQTEIDIDKIYNEVYKEPVNAYYKKNPMQIFKEEDGLDFEISLTEARRMLLEDKTEYIIPLKTIKPKITVADLDSGAFPDKLSTFTTKYGMGDLNRNINIDLAAKSINNVVIMPGEVFSFNDLIGDCSAASGYKAATIYLNGELSTGIGGGICQVSTTIYNTVLRANLEIVKRRNHSMSVTYVPSGQDAMVSIGTSDFQFKNNRDYPIKVVAFTQSGSITCEIYGLKNDIEYEVKLESRTISKTETRYKVETYKILYLNGKEVSRTLLSTDTYKYH